LAKKKKTIEEKIPSDSTRVTISNEGIDKAKEAAKLLAPQFDMPAQAAVEGVIKFGYEQALKLQEHAKTIEENVHLAQQIVSAVRGGDQQLPALPSTTTDVVHGAVSYNNITDEGKDLVL
jgi:hypothetical protein